MKGSKFRAWSKKHNRYLKITGIQYDDNKFAGVFVIYWAVAGIPNTIFLEPEDVILEQYTGLKDKNGKEVYEGDILKWHDNILSLIKHGVVICENGCYHVASYSICSLFGCLCLYEAEVVGNIHENPELLNPCNSTDSEQDDSIHGPYGPIGEENIGGESRRM